jgi:hypothetical protein
MAEDFVGSDLFQEHPAGLLPRIPANLPQSGTLDEIAAFHFIPSQLRWGMRGGLVTNCYVGVTAPLSSQCGLSQSAQDSRPAFFIFVTLIKLFKRLADSDSEKARAEELSL